MSTQVNIATNGRTLTFEVGNINFDESRDVAALRIGREIVDGIYNANEGSK